MKALKNLTFVAATLALTACGTAPLSSTAGLSRNDGATHDQGDDHGRRGRSDDRRGDRGGDRDVRIATPAPQTATLGADFALQLERTRSQDDDAYVFAATGLPEGLNISATDGLISGLVQGAAGTFDVVVSFREANEPMGHRARTVSFQIIVIN